MDLSKCLQIVGDFSPEEIAELEARAEAVASGGEVQQYHYLVAAEQILAEAKGTTAPAPKAEPAAAPAPETVPETIQAEQTPEPRGDVQPAEPGRRVYKRGKLVQETAETQYSDTEQADIDGIEGQLRRYNREADEAKAQDFLRDVVDEARNNPSEKVRAYATKRLEEEAAPADLDAIAMQDKPRRKVERGDVIETSGDAQVVEESLTPAEAFAQLEKYGIELSGPAKALRDKILTLPGMSDVEVVTVDADFVDNGLQVRGEWYGSKNRVVLYNGSTTSTLLHELAHAATLKSLTRHFRPLNDGESQPVTGWQPTTDLGRKLSDLMARTRRYAVAVGQGDLYGFTDIAEFIAEAYSSTKFQQFLARVPALTDAPVGDTLWKRFLDAVRQMLGLEAGDITALDEAISLTEPLLQGPGKTQGVQRSAEKFDSTNDLPPMTPAKPGQRLMREVAGGWKNFPGVLGWLTNRQIDERFSAKNTPLRKLVDKMQKMYAMSKARMQEAHLIDVEWAKLPDDAAIEMQRLMLESTIDRMHVDRSIDHESNAHLDLTSPAIHEKHARLAARYAALRKAHPAAAAVYQSTEAKFRKDWNERGKLLKERIADMYRAELQPHLKDRFDQAVKTPKTARDEFIAQAKLSRSALKALRSMWGDLDAHGEELARVKGPYFPLMRFGKHVVVAKSAKFLRAQAEYQDAQSNYDAVMDDEAASQEDVEAARKLLAEKRQAVSEMKNDPRDYVVEFYEKRTEGQEREQQLRDYYGARGLDMEVYSEMRQEHMARMDTVSPAFMNKLEDTLRAGLPDKDQAAIRAAVRDLYIQAMPERSALKAQLARMNVRGAKATEMRRAFASSSMRNAWHLSRLAYNLPMHEALTELRNGKGDESKLLGNEMAKRFSAAMSYEEPSQAITMLSNAGYLTYLGLSPSFIMMNMAQPWIVSVPIMAGRFGTGAPVREMGTAWMEVGKALTSSWVEADKNWRFELDMKKFSDPGEAAMLKNLFDQGIIDITIEHDMGAVAAGELQTGFGKVVQMSALPAHHTEVLNRVATALAAYRLDKQDAARMRLSPANAEARATKYAEKIVADTHMDYTPENTARFMQSQNFGGLGRLIFQFKKYSQGMIYLLSKNLWDAAKGDKESAKAAAYLMGTTMAMAGTAGLPFALPVSLLAAAVSKLWEDDDEPDIPLMFYNGMKAVMGETAARAVWKGIPAAAGIDMSSRIGLGQLLDPFGLTRDSMKDPFTRDWVIEKAFAIAGPAPSMAANWFEGMREASQGNLGEAWKKITPKFLADFYRGIEQYNGGIESRSGDLLMSPEDLGLGAIMTQLSGFRSTDVTDMYANRAGMARARSARDDVRTGLIRDFVKARMNGESPADVREQIMEFNQRHPGARITYSQLEQAVARQRRDQRQIRNGVRVTKRDADLAEDLGL